MHELGQPREETTISGTVESQYTVEDEEFIQTFLGLEEEYWYPGYRNRIA